MTGKNKRIEQAVALRYEGNGGGAPEVVASGRGSVAATIMAKAREAGVEVVRDADLIELLGKIPVGQQIPPELYQAVAEILAFVYRVNGKMGDRR